MNFRRFGTEHEKLGYYQHTHRRLEYSAIRHLLDGLVNRYGWNAIMEGEYIIGAEVDGQSVTLEPGGQFELSGAPVDTLHKTCSETNSHLYQVRLFQALSQSACCCRCWGLTLTADHNGPVHTPLLGAGNILDAAKSTVSFFPAPHSWNFSSGLRA